MRHETGVTYLMVGDAYAIPLAVSIFSLRQWYAGPIAIVTERSGDGRCVAESIAKDRRAWPLEIAPFAAIDAGATREAIYLYKTVMGNASPFRTTVLVDADTLFVGSIDELWPGVSEVVLTKRSNGISVNTKMRLRCKKWAIFDLRRAMRIMDRTYPYPAINTGVMAWGCGTADFHREWSALAAKNPVHSSDEMAAQLVYPDFNYRLLDYRYNGNVTEDWEKRNVRVWHGVRHQFWQRDRGAAVWMPAYREAMNMNFGSIRSFKPNLIWVGRSVRGDFA